jgi:methionine aminopeptidase
MIILKTRREIEIMKKAGRLVAQAHELVRNNIKPGITTKELDQIVEDFLNHRMQYQHLKVIMDFHIQYVLQSMKKLCMECLEI